MTSTATISERDLQNAIVETARLFGWKAFHSRHAMTKKGWRTPIQYDGKGFVDLLLLHEQTGRLIFAELKSDRGTLSREQEQWLIGLEKVADVCEHVEVFVWTPADWPDQVLAILGPRVAGGSVEEALR